MDVCRSLLCAGISASALFCASPALAESKAEIDATVQAALGNFYAARAEHRELADKAAAMLVFPHVTKAGAGVGGGYGEGALMIHGRTAGYYRIGSASVGAMPRVARQSEVILFMTDAALESFLRAKKWTFGTDAALALLTTGSAGHYNSQLLRRSVLGFVFCEKGLMGDLSLAGSRITRIGAS